MRGCLELIGAVIVIVVAVLGLAAYFGNQSPTKPTSLVGMPHTSLTPAQQQTVSQALREACPRLQRLPSGYTISSATIGNAYDWEKARSGWVRVARVTMAKPGDDTLYYTIGGGTKPGISGKQPISRKRCDGGLASSDADWLLPTPAGTIIDQ